MNIHQACLRAGLWPVLLPATLLAQGVATVSKAPALDEVIALPEFSVSASTDNSWAAASSMSGTRTNVPIQNLARSVQVLTSEFLADLRADTMSDAAAFLTGVTSQGKQDAVFDNNTFTVRGMRQNRHYRDGVKEGFVGMINDSLTVDRIESLRGPSSLLAGVVEPGGMINQISKRPRTRNEVSVKLTSGSWNYFRGEIDASVAPTRQFAVRAAVAYQDSDSWRDWEGSQRQVAYVAAVYRLTPATIFNLRGESIRYEANVAIAVPGIRIPTTASTTSATAAPTFGAYAFGYVPEEIVPWDFSPFGPNNLRTQEVYRVGGDVQHKFNDTFSARAATHWSRSDRRDLRLSGSATTIIARFLNPAAGNVPGNVVADEIRWAATKDDETWDIWTYQVDLRGQFAYAGLKHEAILGLERIESRNWRDRWDTPNSTSTALGAAPSTNPNALTRYKFPTSASGALPAGAFQPAWQEMTDVARYSSPNSYVDQTLTRGAVSFTNVISTRDDRWHLLAGARRDHGENRALTGTTIATIAPQALPIENATSKTVGLLLRPWRPVSFYVSASDSFSGVPTGIDVYGRLLDKPESGESIEAGIKSQFLNGRLAVEAAAFELDRKNTRRQLGDAEIISILGFLPSGARSTQDNGEESKGFEVQVLARPSPAYQASVTYSQIRTRLVAPDNPIRNGGPITGRPRASGSWFHKYTFQSDRLRGFSLTNAVVWVDGKRADSISGTTGQVTNYIPGYARLDFGAGYSGRILGRNATVSLSVRNAADRKIMEGLQSKGDGRSWRLGLGTRF
ncbi:MAG: TonB-dependent receptor plug domain-containing protein [Verrucomicrobia bacterium]|nr:TonB-dependent receptor plug domain-containing protein [Verrucomicrobiota bacterium]